MQLPLTAPIRVSETFVVPGDELRWRFDTSGGPGGQHANKASTRVELSWDLGASRSVPGRVRTRILDRLGRQASHGVITVVVTDTRSQWRNRSIARRRLEEILLESLRVDAERVPTRTPVSVRRRRLTEKRRRSATKAMRQSPAQDE